MAEDPLAKVSDLLYQWAAWRGSDRYFGMGYPSHANFLSQHSGPGALPAWDKEMEVDSMVTMMKTMDRQLYDASIAVLEVESLCRFRNVKGMSADKKAAKLKISKVTMYKRYESFRWWMKGKLTNV
jgi:hypothetical protein